MDFHDALTIPNESIVRPPMLPVGTYRASVSKIPEISTSDKGDYDFVDFQLKVLEAQEDVDADELKEFGPISSVQRRHRFLFNKEDSPEGKQAFQRTLYQIKRFLVDHLKVDANDGTPLKQMLDEAVNQQCLISIGRRSDKVDKEIVYEEIKRTAPV